MELHLQLHMALHMELHTVRHMDIHYHNMELHVERNMELHIFAVCTPSSEHPPHGWLTSGGS